MACQPDPEGVLQVLKCGPLVDGGGRQQHGRPIGSQCGLQLVREHGGADEASLRQEGGRMQRQCVGASILVTVHSRQPRCTCALPDTPWGVYQRLSLLPAACRSQESTMSRSTRLTAAVDGGHKAMHRRRPRGVEWGGTAGDARREQALDQAAAVLGVAQGEGHVCAC